jgi:DNA-binding response OmpR family regulator
MTPPEHTQPKILIVDDEPSNIQLIAKILDKKQYSISYAEDGPTALEMARHSNYDLILLDVIMPDMDGFEVCIRLKEDDRLKDIPVVFLTAKSDIEDVIQGFKIGAVDYVTKPFNDLELTARISNHLELKNRRDMLRTELNFRDKTMSAYAMQVEKRKRLVNEIIAGLEDLNRESSDRYDNQFAALIRKLKAIFENLDLKNFELNFNELQEAFQQRLFEKYNNLTANEVRLSTYLRLNMSTREISEITNQSTRALEAARSRLRKKLRLKSSVNLVNFLQRL